MCGVDPEIGVCHLSYVSFRELREWSPRNGQGSPPTFIRSPAVDGEDITRKTTSSADRFKNRWAAPGGTCTPSPAPKGTDCPYEVDPLTCPACAGPMRIVAFITERAVIERILAHLASRAARPSAQGERRDARALPSATRPTRRSARLRRTPPADAAELV